MKLSQLASRPNLILAWRRITTGGNQQYKRFFRSLYYAYEVALDENIKDLRQRLIGGTYKAQPPERIYIPKPSGLHRPLALLHIEDQIVLQAFADLATKRLQSKRDPLQFKVIFSNIIQKPDNIFFFRRWQDTYRAFQRKIRKNYKDGLRWVADFDLASFYDTISHELLLKTIYPRSTSGDIDWILTCLRTWSSSKASSNHGHGIPQGPIASDFLAECFLLPIDLALRKRRGYMRYVDDVRLFAASEDEIRENVIELEKHCRERGLIPQTGKFAIKRAHKIDEALCILPSISDPQQEAGTEKLTKSHARRWFFSAIGEKPYKVEHKTRLRYVLYRAEPDTKLLQLVLSLVPRYPEHADAFFTYLGRFGYRKPIERLCIDLVKSNPYPYVRGESWHVLARYRRMPTTLGRGAISALTTKAIAIAKQQSGENLMEKWGACHFLCVSEQVGGKKHSRFLSFQSPILQSLLAPVLPVGAFSKGEAVDTYLQRSSFEPGLSICSRLHELKLTLDGFGLETSGLPSQVSNTLYELGVIPTRGRRVDPIAEILESRYGIVRSKSWHSLLESEYVHALGLLKQAEAAFNGGRSFWLACQNSFNHAVFLALQRHLDRTGHPGACKTIDRKAQLVDFGVMLEASGPFSKECPAVADCFRKMNMRRNLLPVSHPYEKKTAVKCRHLKVQERNRLVAKLRTAYADFVTFMP